VSALTGWLTLRAIDNQAKQLHTFESAPPPPNAKAPPAPKARLTPKTKQAPPLPSPVDIKPVPGARSGGPPEASVSPQN
jgi:hypothetical protein